MKQTTTASTFFFFFFWSALLFLYCEPIDTTAFFIDCLHIRTANFSVKACTYYEQLSVKRKKKKKKELCKASACSYSVIHLQTYVLLFWSSSDTSVIGGPCSLHKQTVASRKGTEQRERQSHLTWTKKRSLTFIYKARATTTAVTDVLWFPST